MLSVGRWFLIHFKILNFLIAENEINFKNGFQYAGNINEQKQMHGYGALFRIKIEKVCEGIFEKNCFKKSLFKKDKENNKKSKERELNAAANLLNKKHGRDELINS